MNESDLEITPDFIIVGAQKCGTTSLHHWLSDHPECYMTQIKEPHYFANFIPRGDVATSSTIIQDPLKYSARYYNAKPDQVKGEASPSYFLDAHAAERVAHANKNCRIIICVRDPVERAYSQYRMRVIAGVETRSFEETIQECLERPRNRDWTEQNYIELSSYGMQIQNYIEVFPSSQILVCTLDEMKTDPVAIMAKISNFLKIDSSYWKTYSFIPHHQGHVPRSRLARRLLGSSVARAFGRLFVPKRLRPVVAHNLLGKRARGRVSNIYGDMSTSLIWECVESEILHFERLIGQRLPELWKTHPDAKRWGMNDKRKMEE